MSKIYKEFIQCNDQNKSNLILKWLEEQNRYFSNEDIQTANKYIEKYCHNTIHLYAMLPCEGGVTLGKFLLPLWLNLSSGFVLVWFGLILVFLSICFTAPMVCWNFFGKTVISVNFLLSMIICPGGTLQVFSVLPCEELWHVCWLCWYCSLYGGLSGYYWIHRWVRLLPGPLASGTRWP